MFDGPFTQHRFQLNGFVLTVHLHNSGILGVWKHKLTCKKKV